MKYLNIVPNHSNLFMTEINLATPSELGIILYQCSIKNGEQNQLAVSGFTFIFTST